MTLQTPTVAATQPPAVWWKRPEWLDASPLQLLRRCFQTGALPCVAVPLCGFPDQIGSVICLDSRVHVTVEQQGNEMAVLAGQRVLLKGGWLDLNALLATFPKATPELCPELRVSLQELAWRSLGLDGGTEHVTVHAQRYPVQCLATPDGLRTYVLSTAQGQVCFALEYRGRWALNLALCVLPPAAFPSPQGDPSCSTSANLDASMPHPLQRPPNKPDRNHNASRT